MLLLVVIAGFAWINLSKEKPGAITIESTPLKVEVLLNGNVVANSTPFTLDNLDAGSYVLTVRAEGYETVIKPVTVGPGEALIEMITLPKKAGHSSIIVKTDPEGLHVHVNGKDTKRTTPATIAGLPAGKHQVMLMRTDGTIVHRGFITVGAGAAEVLELDTRKLQPLLDVTSVPAGAVLRVNGQLKGTTPVTVAGMSPGEVQIELEHEGCAPYRSAVRLERATLVPLEAKLSCGGKRFKEVPSGAEGKLNVTATVVSDVFVDGAKIGRTPVMGMVVPRGRRTVKLVPVAPGKSPFVTEILVGEGIKNLHHQF